MKMMLPMLFLSLVLAQVSCAKPDRFCAEIERTTANPVRHALHLEEACLKSESIKVITDVADGAIIVTDHGAWHIGPGSRFSPASGVFDDLLKSNASTHTDQKALLGLLRAELDRAARLERENQRL